MLKIEVKYRPISWLPFTRKVDSNVPQNWGDVTQEQLIAIACLYKSAISDIAFLKVISGLKKRILNKLSDYERYKLMEIFEFVGDQKPYHKFIIRRIELRWLRSLSLSKWSKPGFTLCAPEGKLKGITFGQFIFADTYFANYQQSNDEPDLNKFIASLYLRKDEPFDEKRIQSRHFQIGKIDKNIREAIVLNYQLMHEWLALAYPLIFHTAVELTTIPTVSDDDIAVPEVKRDPNIWIKVFQNFVGDDIIHDEVWAAKPVNTIFAYMTRKYKENARSHK
ncbi:MAG: hypothetical protein Q8S54_01560 [Bacteroidota bacterium]|nr:hypothetical protein [Odoribacter sp.]MDP3641855.1 hypothetical protein [Bacteroidota bacterium]